MRLLLGSIALAALLAQPAIAADLPAKAPVYRAPPPVVFSWTGLYVGGHSGGAWGDWTSQSIPGPQPLFGLPGRNFDSNPSGWLGGAQIGFNWQIGTNLVLGAEADISWTDLGATENAPITTNAGVPLAGSNQFTSRDVDWLTTVRGRIGVSWDRALLYFTGGAAWAKVSYAANYATIAVAYPIGSFSETKSGYVLGGGLEYAFTNNWTIRGEYLYYRFKGTDATCFCNAPFFVSYHWDDTKMHVVRAALNYKFDWGAPVVAKY